MRARFSRGGSVSLREIANFYFAKRPSKGTQAPFPVFGLRKPNRMNAGPDGEVPDVLGKQPAPGPARARPHRQVLLPGPQVSTAT